MTFRRRIPPRTAPLLCLFLSVLTSALTGCNPADKPPAKPTEGTGGPTAPSSNPGATQTKKPHYRIVTTTGMVADLVQHVVGDRAEVTALIESGVDPHLFKPERNHVKRLMDADVVIYSGLNLEGQMTDTFKQLARSGKPVQAVTEKMDRAKLRIPEDAPEHPDPHVWMDVSLWSETLDDVEQFLSKYDPPFADHYKANATAYRKELSKLDAYVRKAIASIPETQRTLVTAHDAFGYFSRVYGIEVESVQGVSTESEAGVFDVNRLVDLLVERKLPAIFVESSVNPKNIEAVIAGAKSRGVTVQVGGELFSDAMGEAGTYEGTYIGMIDHNATTITRTLGGTVPERGLHGKLKVAP